MRAQAQMRTKQHWHPLMVIVVLALIGCTPQPVEPTPTDSPVPPPTDTPAPTDTPLPSPTPTETFTPTPDAEATAAAIATEMVAAIVEEIDADLQEVGLSTDRGDLGWVGVMPIVLEVDTYGSLIYEPIDPGQEYSDFALRYDVTWDSSSGLAGCGAILRSETDIGNGEQYRFYTLRLSGLPAWDVELWNFDRFQSNLTGDIRTSQAINLEAGSVNKYLLVAEGSLLTLYANGTRLGSVTILGRSNGEIAFFAFQESGETTCAFDHAWLWTLSE